MKTLRDFADGLKGLLSSVEAETVEAEEIEVDVARSGEFPSSAGKVKLDAALLQELADTFDPRVFRPVNKLGHPKQDKTDEPAYGPLTGVRYDKNADRLFVKTKPTPDLLQKIREKRFPERSMEYTPNYRGSGKARLLGLGWLGASAPAIDSLASLGYTSDGDQVFTFALGDAPAEAGTEPVQAPTKVSPEKPLDGASSNETEQTHESMKETKMAEEAVALAEEKKRSDRFAALLRNRAEESVNAFLERHKDKIPMALHKKGIKAVLMHFAVKEGDDSSTVTLAMGDERPAEHSEYALVAALLSELPPLVSATEQVEIAKGGDTGTDNTVAIEFADADQDSVERDQRAQKIMFAAKSKGEPITYLEALRREESDRK